MLHAIRMLRREWRSGELAVLLLALLISVTAMSAVGFLISRVDQAVDAQASEVLAADLLIRSAQQIDVQFEREAQDAGLSTARLLTFPSVIHSAEESSLAAIRAVSPGYPLRGRMRVSDTAFGTPRVTDDTPTRGDVWVDHRLLARIGADVGSELDVGASRLRVSQALDYRPDQGWQFLNLAPTVLMNIDDIPATELVQESSRVTHHLLFAGAATDIRAYRAVLKPRLNDLQSLRDIEDTSPQIRNAVERSKRFLGLSALISTLLASVAVAMAARQFANRHLDTVALMKSMGARQSFVFKVVVYQLLIIAIVAGLIGAGLGYIAQQGFAFVIRDWIKGGVLPPAEWYSGALGFAAALVVLAGFALPPLARLRKVPPARVLRRDLEPPPLRYTLVYALAGFTVLLMLYAMIRDLRLVLYVAAGLLVTICVQALCGWLLVRLLARLRGRVGVSWRYGLANIARRGRESIVQLVAFGSGLMVLLLLTFVRDDLLAEWRDSLPDQFPNNFLINIQPGDQDAIRKFFAENNLDAPQLVPLVRARLSAINDVAVGEREYSTGQGRRFATREQNLTWAKDLQEDNQVIDGQWWEGGAEPQVSVEDDFAQSLGLKLGDKLTIDIAGEKLVVPVTSLRTVQWDSFRPNFFMVFSPGSLDETAGTMVTSLYLDPGDRTVLRDFVRRFPSVSVIDMEAILSQVRNVIEQATMAVQFVFLFTLFAGLTVLFAAIQSTRDERRFESAVLRTLGAKRRAVFLGVVAEFSVLGLLAGVLAAIGASALGYLIATRLFELSFRFNPGLWLTGIMVGTVLIGLSGTLATRSVVNHAPINTLRKGNL